MDKQGASAVPKSRLVLLFAPGILLLNWPLLTVAFDQGLSVGLMYLYAVWAALVVVIAAASARIKSRRRREEERV